MKTKAAFVIISSVLCAACTGPVNERTVIDMPTGYLCRILGDDYISLPSEQRAIYGELERRGAQCVNHTQKVIVQVE